MNHALPRRQGETLTPAALVGEAGRAGRGINREYAMTTNALFDPDTKPPTELVARPTPTPMSLIEAAVANDWDAERLTKLFDLKERDDRNKAADAFSAAVTEFQSRCGIIVKERSAGQGNFAYRYASYDDIMAAISPLLKECGLAISFSSEQADKALKITCRVRKGIHFEDHTLTVPLPDMRVNETQKMGAALSYAKRYALCGALNIVVGDEDNDAGGLAKTISEEQSFDLDELMQRKVFNRMKFYEYFGIGSIGELPAKKFEEAMTMLSKKPEKQ